MIGLRNLPDGGHVLEHPLGPVYVTVRAGGIVRAELAVFGDPNLVNWSGPSWVHQRMLARLRARNPLKGVVANV